MNRLREKFARFMQGRYGMDECNQFLMHTMLICMLLSVLLRSSLMNTLVWILIIAVYFRAFSKNHSARYKENQKFVKIKYQVQRKLRGLFPKSKDPNYRIFKCPTCGQKVRVPKGKGTISIHCPKCNHDFIKRT